MQEGIGVAGNYYPSTWPRNEENHGKPQSAESTPVRDLIAVCSENEILTKNIRPMFTYKNISDIFPRVFVIHL